MWLALLICAALPAVLFARNLSAYRRLTKRCHPERSEGPRNRATATGSEVLRSAQDDREFAVSVLIPARNEAANIRAAVASALANRDVELEVVVFDDNSTDDTAQIVRELAGRDKAESDEPRSSANVAPTGEARVRVVTGEPLPAGWNGKQFACWQLAQAAQHDTLVFLDADVRLAPDALGRMRTFLDEAGADLASGIPRQETGTFVERLLIPLIHWTLLGFLPMRRMRASRSPAYGAGCGQLFIARRAAYLRAGGHAAIKATRHDGIKLPRAFRAAGFVTDLFDATDVASCRMYRGARETWRGLLKNATEGLGAPATIVPVTLLFGAGQVLPALLCFSGQGSKYLWAAVALGYLPRVVGAWRFRQSWLGAALHPVGALVLLAIQWTALAREWAGRPVTWKGRVDWRKAAAGAAAWLVLATGGGSAELPQAPAFTLHDQFDRPHVVAFPRATVSVLTVADQAGSKQLEAWIAPLKEDLGETVEFLGVANVSGVPGPLRPLIKGRFRKTVAHPVLLDWQGAVIRATQPVAGQANLYVVSRQGVVVHQDHGAVTPAKLTAVLVAARAALAGTTERLP